MKPSPHTQVLCYNAGVAALLRVAAVCQTHRIRAAAYIPTPRSGTSRAILRYGLGERASHGRTDRPSPHLTVPAWQGRRFALPLHPSRAGVSHPMHPCGEPSCSLRPMTEALPLGHHSGAFLPLKTQTKAPRPWNLTRAIAPLTTRRRFSHPGTHDQSLRALDDAQGAFMPLHPDEGTPLDPPPWKPAERRCA